jgi:5-methylcytosine-specific restriction protein A
MAVTKGHGNPHWNREETILALDLYFRLGPKLLGKNAEAVSELSEFLRKLPYHQAARKNSTFRNIDGVGFKLQNLRNALTGEGLSNTSKTDRKVTEEFGDDSREVARLAQLIRSSTQFLDVDDYQLPDDIEDEYYEGKTAFALHRKTERSKGLRRDLLSKRKDAELKCAICDLSRPDLERPLHEALFEVHHVFPLSEVDGQTKTKLRDVELLCASCHRGIHKLMSIRGEFVSVESAKRVIGRREN